MGKSAFSFTGSGGGDRFTNPNPSTAGAGGIPVGSTFDNQSFPDVMTRMFYPYVAPSFSAFSLQGIAGTLEVGDTIPASLTFLWSTAQPANVQANSVELRDITGSVVLATGLANDGSEALTLGAPVSFVVAGSYTFRVIATNTQSATFQRDATYNWRHRGFYGGSALGVLTEADVEALVPKFPATGYPGTYVMSAAGYKYICMPDALGGQINTVKDPGNFDMPMAGPAQGYTNVDGGGFGYQLVSVTNAFGVVMNYRVYRTYNALGSSTTLTVT